MKTKNDKKFELNKTTLVNLEDSQLNDLKGGWTFPVPSEQSCKFDC